MFSSAAATIAAGSTASPILSTSISTTTSALCFFIVSQDDVPVYKLELAMTMQKTSSTSAATGTVGVASSSSSSAALHEFIAHAAMDMVQEQMYQVGSGGITSSSSSSGSGSGGGSNYLRIVDSFNDIVVSAWITIGNTVFLLLLKSPSTAAVVSGSSNTSGGGVLRNEEAVKGFFQEVNDLFIRETINPFHRGFSHPISPASLFDKRVREAIRKYRL
jgi:hypothetical protein